jgi:hypothetical protein
MHGLRSDLQWPKEVKKEKKGKGRYTREIFDGFMLISPKCFANMACA